MVEISELKEQALKELGVQLYSGKDELGEWACYIVTDDSTLIDALEYDSYETGSTELEAVQNAIAKVRGA